MGVDWPGVAVRWRLLDVSCPDEDEDGTADEDPWAFVAGSEPEPEAAEPEPASYPFIVRSEYTGHLVRQK